MKAQTVRNHTILWLLVLLAAIVVGFFMATVKPAAQAPGTAPDQATTEQTQPAK